MLSDKFTSFILSIPLTTRFTIGALVVVLCCALVAYAEARRTHIAID